MGSNWVWEATGDSAACRLATGRALLGAVHIGGFLQRTVRKGAISKEKKGFFRGDAFSLGEGFYPAHGLCSLWGRERAQVADDLPGAGPENPSLVD